MRANYLSANLKWLGGGELSNGSRIIQMDVDAHDMLVLRIDLDGDLNRKLVPPPAESSHELRQSSTCTTSSRSHTQTKFVSNSLHASENFEA